MLKNKKFAFFDMDGTLIDSVGIWNQIDQKLIEKLANKKIDETTKIFADTYVDIKDSMQEINKHIPKIEEKNKNLLSDMSDILKWG